MVSPTDTMQTALRVAEMGLKTLPLKVGMKAPDSDHGVHDAISDPAAVTALWSSRKGGGLGLVPGQMSDGTYLLVIDTDTADATAFMTDMLGVPTVLPAGHENGDHPGGAHWYVVLPRLIDGLTKTSAKHIGIDLLGAEGKDDSYVVAPPTILPIKGRDVAYRWNGPVYPLDNSHAAFAWLQRLAALDLANRTARKERPRGESTNPMLDEWMRDTSWSELLTEDGWGETNKAHSCGCPVWTHPWGASTERSATVHEEGCLQSKSDFPGGALHCWSTTAQDRVGGASASKFMYVAHVRYGGDYAEARKGEGIPDDNFFSYDGSLDPRMLTFDVPPLTPSDPEPNTEVPMDVPPAPQVTPGGVVTGRLKADGWIMTAAEAAAHGWSTPAPLRDNGKTDESFSPWDRSIFPLGHPCAPDLMNKIFDYNDFTRTVFQNARAYTPVRTGPVALLLTELVRGGKRANPAFQPTPGTPLSLYVLRVGDSGKGKSVCMKHTKWTYMGHPKLGQSVGHSGRESEDDTRKMGSGQVLVFLLSEEVERTTSDGKTYKERVQTDPSVVWLEEAEFRSILRRAKGDSSVIFDSLNEGWAGEHPGTATMTNGWVDLPNPFNVFLTGGLQTAVWTLLLEQITGFLQRCLMVGVSDPWRVVNDVIVNPPTPGYIPPMIPSDARSPGTFTLCQEIHDAIKLADSLSAFEHTAADDEWESHLTQVRVRIACLMALRSGTTVVDSDLWEWSGYLIEHHRRVREWTMKASSKSRKKTLGEKGAELAQIHGAKQAALRARLEEAAQKILDTLGNHNGTATARELARGLGADKDMLQEGITLLERQHIITVAPGKRRDSVIVSINPDNDQT